MILIGERIHQESAYSHMEYHYESVSQMAVKLIKDGFLQVIVFGKEPVGFLAATIEQSFFGRDTVAMDRILALDLPHRSKCFMALEKIINNYHEWARKRGAKRIFLATTTGIDEEKVAKLYTAIGFNQIGTIHEA